MVNRVTLIGNLGKDPEIRTYDNGTMVAKFTVATNESYKDKQGEWQKATEWHNIVVWREQAERAERQLKKGSLVYIDGKLTHRSWQDQDGNTRYITEVRANSFRVLEKREQGNNNNNTYGNNFPQDDKYASTQETATSNANNISSTPSNTPILEADDTDDLPF